jgi:uncharacterized membrane protein YphA (DoxX/SURF4 family)
VSERKIFVAQLFARIAVSASFISAVADRFGIWGPSGDSGIVWGNWNNFLEYSNSINSWLPSSAGNFLALSATALEIILPLFLLTGYKTKYAAGAAGILLMMFAISLTISFGIKATLDYSVLTGIAACFLISSIV